MPIHQTDVDRISRLLRLETPLIAVYDAETEADFEPLVRARGRACCFAYYERWLSGDTLLIDEAKGDFINPDAGCPGAQIAFGLKEEYPPFMAHFLTDGKGAPMGEQLKAEPGLAQQFIDNARPPEFKHSHVLIGPLRVEQWEHARSVTFLVDPDRLSAVMTLATYHSGPEDVVQAPFSSGCGLMLREMQNMPGDPAILGGTDIAMRKYLPPNILALSVSPARFERMLTAPDDSFLGKDWWNGLMDIREKRAESAI